MKYQAYMGVIALTICFGLYAIATRQTAGDLCRKTGRNIAGFARSSGASDDAIVGFWQGLERIGHSITDSCSQP